jgi:hypothetical protein
MSPTGPPDKSFVINTMDYKSIPDLTDAISAAYQQGYEFAFTLQGLRGIGQLIVFQGYSKG